MTARPSRSLVFSLLAALAVAATPVCAETPAAPPLETEEAKLFYALGFALSQQAAGFALSEAELEKVLVGFREGALKQPGRVDLQQYLPKLQAMAQERARVASSGERTAGEAWRKEMAAAPGAVATESGLVYFSLREGTGASPTAEDAVKVHYHGTLRDGSVFDSSVDRGEPATFGLGQVISCWTEGVQKLKVGGKARLICPPELAYGDRGAGPKIGPGATLAFEVELLEIVPKQ